VKCRKYVIITAYLPQEAPWTRVLRQISEAGGTIVSKDEIRRRLVVEAPASRARQVLEALGQAQQVGVEVKAACRGSPGAVEVARRLRSLGFYIARSGEGPAYRATGYGVLGGHYVMVHAWGSRLAVKAGRPAKTGRVTGVLPHGVFVGTPEEAESLLRALDQALRELRGVL